MKKGLEEIADYGTAIHDLKVPSKGLSFSGTYFSLVKSMIGTGILYFPSSFNMGGVVFSFFACIIVSALAYMCMRWLSKAHDVYHGTYAEIVGKSIGEYGVYAIDMMIFVTQVGPGLVGVGFILTNSKKSFDTLGVSLESYQILLVLLAVLIPLCLIKTIHDQTWAYLIADIIIIGNILIIGIYSSASGGSTSNIEIVNPSGMFFTLGILVYGFEGIALILPIKSEMKQTWEFDKLLGYMIASIVVVFLWFSIIGVYSYGNDLEDLITLNLPDSYWVAVMLLMYVGAIVLGMPLCLHPAFQIMDKYLHLDGYRSNFARTALVVLVILLGYFARHSLGICVSVIGGLFCAPLAFVFPAIIHLKLTASSKPEQLISWGMIGLGVVFGVSAVMSTLN